MSVVEQQRPVDGRRPDAQPAELHICKTPLCGQAIARVACSGSIYPLVKDAYIESGDYTIICPVCRRKHEYKLAAILSQYRQSLTGR